MTEPLAPLSDEDLSAALDGVAGFDVEARIQADPSARQRLDALRHASAAIGQAPPALAPGALDAVIDRAIQAGNDPPAPLTGAPTSSDGVVAPLAARRPTSAGMQRWLVAAVVIALVAIGLGLVYSGTHDSRTDTTAADVRGDRNTAHNNETGSPSVDAEADATPGRSAAGQAAEPDLDPSAQKPADLDRLGTFADVSSLRTVLRAGFPADAAPAVGDRPTKATVTRCNDFIHTILGDEALEPEPDEVGWATVAGDDYLVYEFSFTTPSAKGTNLITAADPDTCDPLFTFVR